MSCRYFAYISRQMALHMTQGTDDCTLPMAPPRLVALIRHAMPEDGIVCLDNGLYKVRMPDPHFPSPLLPNRDLINAPVTLPFLPTGKVITHRGGTVQQREPPLLPMGLNSVGAAPLSNLDNSDACLMYQGVQQWCRRLRALLLSSMCSLRMRVPNILIS